MFQATNYFILNSKKRFKCTTISQNVCMYVCVLDGFDWFYIFQMPAETSWNNESSGSKVTQKDILWSFYGGNEAMVKIIFSQHATPIARRLKASKSRGKKKKREPKLAPALHDSRRKCWSDTSIIRIFYMQTKFIRCIRALYAKRGCCVLLHFIKSLHAL